jgi:ferredoxin
MRLVIDYDRCTGHGRCFSLCRELFTDDDSGYGQVIGDGEVTAALMPAAERAVRACPEQAIRLEA